MTREYLLRLIYMSEYCPDYNCQSTTLEQCQECCNKALTEYENEIYNKALDDYKKELEKMAIDNRKNGYTNGPVYLADTIDVINKLKKGKEQ